MKYFVSVICILAGICTAPITSRADNRVVVIPLLKNKKIVGDAEPADVVQGKTFTSADGEHTGIRPPAPVSTDYVNIYGNVGGTIDGAGIDPPDPRFTMYYRSVGFQAEVGYGVNDLLTGLIWMKSPSSSEKSWPNAATSCENLETSYVPTYGARPVSVEDWRLPTVKEINSLFDYARGVSPAPNALVQPNYFSNISSGIYWTDTISMVPCSPVGTKCNIVHVVDIDHATVSKQLIHPDGEPPEHFYWCVRGPYGLEY
jgi:hypothetical protein